jgi:hypothetical protein
VTPPLRTASRVLPGMFGFVARLRYGEGGFPEPGPLQADSLILAVAPLRATPTTDQTRASPSGQGQAVRAT